MTKKTTLKAFIFDVDGTLADTERDGHRVAFNLAFEKFELDWHWDISTYGKLLAVTGGKERMKYFCENFISKDQIPPQLDRLIIELHQQKTNFYTELLSTGAIPLRTGVERLINEARAQNIRLAIATTTTPENVTALLSHTLGEDSINWFEVIGAGDVVPAKKPAPDIYTYVLDKMNLKAEQCIAFEDSSNGIKSSIAANLKTIITINDYTKDHDFSQASLVLNEMGKPNQPFKVIAGEADDFNYLNCALVEKTFIHH